ncbi:hypothetical protein P9112_007048 [Eukaryota sp. TZLM1-RC]
MRFRCFLWPNNLPNHLTCKCGKPLLFTHLLNCKHFITFRSKVHNNVRDQIYVLCKSYRVDSFLEPLLSKLILDDPNIDSTRYNRASMGLTRGDLVVPGLNGSFTILDAMSIDPCNSSNEHFINSDVNNPLLAGEKYKIAKYAKPISSVNENSHAQYNLCPFVFSLLGSLGKAALAFLEDFVVVVKERTGRIFNRVYWQNRIVFSIFKGMVTLISDSLSSFGKFSESLAINCFDVGEAVYNNFYLNPNLEKAKNIIKILGLNVPSRDLACLNDKKGLTDKKGSLKSILSRWLPLAPRVLSTVIQHVPSPQQCSLSRFQKLTVENLGIMTRLGQNSTSPLICSIAKVFIIGRDVEASSIEDSNQLPFLILLFWRFYVFVKSCKVEGIYLPLGSRFSSIPNACAGSVIAVRGCEGFFHKGGIAFSPCLLTSSDHKDTSSAQIPIFKSMETRNYPVVKVEVSPFSLGNNASFLKALSWLDQSDPSVEVGVLSSGGHFVAGSGDLHLAQCLSDLARWTGCKIKTSPPIFSLRETVSVERPQAASRITVDLGNISLTLRVFSLPFEASQYLTTIPSIVKSAVSGEPDAISVVKEGLSKFNSRVNRLVDKDLIWAFGPRHNGSCLLVNSLDDDVKREMNWDSVFGKDTKEKGSAFDSICNAIRSAFQVFCLAGPLCGEPLVGVVVMIDSIVFHSSSDSASSNIISSLIDGYTRGFMASSPRLAEAMLKCDISTPQGALSSVYAVLSKRRSKITLEELRDGSDTFVISCFIPLLESFGFVEDLRSQSSGQASAQISFDHWRLIEDDPLHVPDEEELEEYGDKGIVAPNVARDCMNLLRRRKGLLVKDDYILDGQKQRTLKR